MINAVEFRLCLFQLILDNFRISILNVFTDLLNISSDERTGCSFSDVSGPGRRNHNMNANAWSQLDSFAHFNFSGDRGVNVAAQHEWPVGLSPNWQFLHVDLSVC